MTEQQFTEVRIHRDRWPYVLVAIVVVCLSVAALAIVGVLANRQATANAHHDQIENALQTQQAQIETQQKQIDANNARLLAEAQFITVAINKAESHVTSEVAANREIVIDLAKELNAAGIPVTVPPAPKEPSK